MSLRGLLNGQPVLTFPSGRIEAADVADGSVGQGPEITLKCHLADGRVWECRLVDLGPDPRGEYSSSSARDFLGYYWADAEVLVVAGDSKAVIIDAKSGRILLEVPLLFTAQSSLDVLSVLADDEVRLLFLVSTRRVAAVGRDLRVKWTWQPEGIVKSVSSGSGGTLRFEYYDAADPELPAVAGTLNADGQLTL